MGLKRHSDIHDELVLDQSIVMLAVLLGILVLFAI